MARLLVAALLLTLVAGACLRQESEPMPVPNSGIEGRVLIGPTCPVVMEGQDCDDRPYQATLRLLESPGAKLIGEVTSDVNGFFRVPLPPGDYTLVPESGNPLPFAEEQDVTVVDGEFTSVTVLYDSGIR